MTHSNIRSLGGSDFFFDGWNESYVVQSAMQNNVETRFFGITTGRVRLDCEMVEGVRNHIGLAKMIMDFQLIILDQF
jgi:hypothetical protein